MSELDEFDEKILRILKRNGRISNLELASKIGLSSSACLRRVQDLEKRGVIKGYRAVVDSPSLGVGFIAYLCVGLSEHSKRAQKEFERAISKSEEVKECHNITGAFEYILRVEASDLKAYKLFHTEVLGTLPQVNAITTYVVLESSKDERA